MGEKGDWGELGKVQGGAASIGMYCMREEFKKNEKRKKEKMTLMKQYLWNHSVEKVFQYQQECNNCQCQ